MFLYTKDNLFLSQHSLGKRQQPEAVASPPQGLDLGQFRPRLQKWGLGLER